MKYYLDTSAFIKFFYQEKNSDKLTKLIIENPKDIYISDLVIVEFYSAIHRRYRMGEISSEDLLKLNSLFEEEVNNFNVEVINSDVLSGAKSIILEAGIELGIRTLDAIHLSCFRFVSDENWIFASSDLQLINIAKKVKINCLDI